MGLADVNKKVILLGTDIKNKSHYGHFAHELAHTVLSIVYENKCLPYCKENQTRERDFKAIYNESLEAYEKYPNFEEIMEWCFEHYRNAKSNVTDENRAELIVRIPHMLAIYRRGDAKELAKLEQLRTMYKQLFDFFDDKVLNDLKCFNKFKLAKEFKLLDKVKQLPIAFAQKKLKEKEILKLSRKNVIIKTNSPWMTLTQIYSELLEKEPSFIQLVSKNLFVDLQEIQNSYELFETYITLIKSCEIKRVIIDASNFVLNTSECPKIFKEENMVGDINYFVIISGTKFSPNELKSMRLNGFNEPTIKHDFNQLHMTSKKLLSELKVRFQNEPLELENIIQEPCSEIINFFLEHSRVADVSEQSKLNDDDEQELSNVRYLVQDYNKNRVKKKVLTRVENLHANDVEIDCLKIFMERSLLKKIKNEEHKAEDKHKPRLRSATVASPPTSPPSAEVQIEPEEGVLSYNVSYTYKEIKPEKVNDKFVILSDFAGTGKSVLFKTLAKTLMEKSPINWISFVNLKDYFDDLSDVKFEVILGNILAERKQGKTKFSSFCEDAPVSFESLKNSYNSKTSLCSEEKESDDIQSCLKRLYSFLGRDNEELSDSDDDLIDFEYIQDSDAQAVLKSCTSAQQTDKEQHQDKPANNCVSFAENIAQIHYFNKRDSLCPGNILWQQSSVSIDKHDIDKYLKDSESDVFQQFFSRSFLRSENPLEVSIFHHLYKDEKCIIFFDGLDRLREDARKNFLKLCRTFRSKQVWLSVQKPKKVRQDLNSFI